MGRPSPIDNVKAYDPKIPCHGFVIAPDRTMEEVKEEIRRTGKIPGPDVFLFKEGIIGALSNDQDENPEICNPALLILEPTPQKLAYRLELMRGLAEGKFVCIDATSKVAAVLNLMDRARKLKDPDERETIEKAIEEIMAFPDCQR